MGILARNTVIVWDISMLTLRIIVLSINILIIYETYVNDEEGFRLFYPNLWIRDETPLNYSFVFDPKFSAIRDGVTCTISYGVVDEAAILSSGTASTSLSYGGSGYGPDQAQ